MFMVMLKQPETIVIGKVFPLSLDVFMSVSIFVQLKKSNFQFCSHQNLV